MALGCGLAKTGSQSILVTAVLATVVGIAAVFRFAAEGVWKHLAMEKRIFKEVQVGLSLRTLMLMTARECSSKRTIMCIQIVFIECVLHTFLAVCVSV